MGEFTDIRPLAEREKALIREDAKLIQDKQQAEKEAATILENTKRIFAAEGFLMIEDEKPKIKIYDMDGGITWIAAADRLDALVAMAENFGYSEGKEGFSDFIKDQYSGFEDLEYIKEMSAAEMETFKFTDKDEDEDGLPVEITITFKAKLDEMIKAGEKFPVFFATSEV